MSLVRAATIDTPEKAESVARDLEDLDEEEGDQPPPQLRKGPAAFSSSPHDQEDGEQVLVLEDDGDGEGEEKEAKEHAMDVDVEPTRYAEPEKPPSPSKKDRRRSSFLGRAWPFGSSSQEVYADERQATPAKEGEPSEEPEMNDGNANQWDDEEEDEQGVDSNQSPWSTPRLPHSQSSPGRLVGSPSFLNHGRRNLSLRTKTLLKHSAALVERLESEAMMESTPASPSKASPLQEAVTLPTQPEEEDESSAPSSDLQSSPSVAEDGAADEDDEDEVEKSLSLGSLSLDEEPAPLPARQLQPLSLKADLPSFVVQERSVKRQSMPVAAKRRSLFGFLPIRPSKEAEDVVGTVYRATSDETSQSSSDSMPSTPAVAFESLRAPAREALRYLLSNKTRAPPTPVEAEAAPATAAPATAAPRYGMLRELMLGRPENVALLDQTRKTTKRGSLILSSSGQVAPQLPAETTPDVVFLRQIFKLPRSETDTDVQLKNVRFTFDEFAFMLDEDSQEEADDEDREDFADFIVSPAARRALLQTASSFARLSSDEAAVQSAAFITSMQEVEAAAAEQGDVEPRRRKTRRGCRGGRRRGKSSSSFAQLTGQDGSDVTEMPEVAEERIEADGEVKAPVETTEENMVQPKVEPVSSLREAEPTQDESMQVDAEADQQRDAPMDIPAPAFAEDEEAEVPSPFASSSPPSTPKRRRTQLPEESSSPAKAIAREEESSLPSPLKSSRKVNHEQDAGEKKRSPTKAAAQTVEEEEKPARPASPVKRSPVKALRTPRTRAAQPPARGETVAESSATHPATEDAEDKGVVSSPAPPRSSRRQAAAVTTSQSSPTKSAATRSTATRRGGRHKKNASSVVEPIDPPSVDSEKPIAAAPSSAATKIEETQPATIEEESHDVPLTRGRKAAQPVEKPAAPLTGKAALPPKPVAAANATRSTRGRRAAAAATASHSSENDEEQQPQQQQQPQEQADVADKADEPSAPSPAVTRRAARGGGAKKASAPSIKSASSPVKPSAPATSTAKRTTRGAASTGGRGKRGQQKGGKDEDGEDEAQSEPHSEPSPPTLRTRSGRTVRKV